MKDNVVRIAAWGGIGDVLLLTPALRALRQKRPGAKIVVYCRTRHHRDVLLNNPNIDALVPLAGWRSIAFRWYRRLAGNAAIFEANWGRARASVVDRIHAAKIIGQILGVSVEDTTPQVFLTPAERRRALDHLGDRPGRLVALHAQGACTPNKNWRHDRWAELVAQNPRLTFLHLGRKGEPKIDGARSLLGLPLRASVAVLSHCRALVGIESGLSHAAAALGIPGVVLFGASAEAVAGYSRNTNLRFYTSCAPCIDTLQDETCPFDRKCMGGISTAMVSRALEKLLEQESPAGPG